MWLVSSTRSALVTTKIIPFPALMICPARDWSSLARGSVASISRAETSDSSMAASERMAENFSTPTSRLPGRRRPAVSRISIACFLNLIVTRLISRVVPCWLLTRACCFLARPLKRLDLPTLGRPIRASLMGWSVVFLGSRVGVVSLRVLMIACFKS